MQAKEVQLMQPVAPVGLVAPVGALQTVVLVALEQPVAPVPPVAPLQTLASLALLHMITEMGGGAPAPQRDEGTSTRSVLDPGGLGWPNSRARRDQAVFCPFGSVWRCAVCVWAASEQV